MKWPQFGLRTLLILVGIGAVLCWGYWIGWPWWLKYREYHRFLSSIQQIKAGMTELDVMKFVKMPDRGVIVKTSGITSANSKFPKKRMRTYTYIWPDYNYCIFFIGDEPEGNEMEPLSKQKPLLSIEAYRLETVPPGYRNRLGLSGNLYDVWFKSLPDDAKYQAYVEEFAEFLTGDRKKNPGFKYELIYSDPPADAPK